MGADLYLNSVFRKHRDKYAPKFDHWVAKRNALPPEFASASDSAMPPNM
jgi:hypothetical protein